MLDAPMKNASLEQLSGQRLRTGQGHDGVGGVEASDVVGFGKILAASATPADQPMQGGMIHRASAEEGP